MASMILTAATALALAGPAAAQAPAAPRAEPVPVAGQAHLVYRIDPHAKPIEGRVTVLQPAAAGDEDDRAPDAPQVEITIVQIART